MIRLRLFWIEAIAVPLFMLYQVGTTPAPSPYRWPNLIIWARVLVTANLVLARNEWKKRRPARQEI